MSPLHFLANLAAVAIFTLLVWDRSKNTICSFTKKKKTIINFLYWFNVYCTEPQFITLAYGFHCHLRMILTTINDNGNPNPLRQGIVQDKRVWEFCSGRQFFLAYLNRLQVNSFLSPTIVLHFLYVSNCPWVLSHGGGRIDRGIESLRHRIKVLGSFHALSW